jgi:hypothetical protein
MFARKTQIVGSALIGAVALNGADAFTLPGSQIQVSESSALRGATPTLAQPASGDLNAFSSPLGAATAVAAGVAVLGSFAGTGRGRVGARKQAQRVACNFSKETALGAQAPLGFFDPLDFCKDEETFKDLRAKELKHGRLAMMGALGMLTQSLVQVPGMDGVPKDVTACLVGNGQVGFGAILAVIAALEVGVFVQDPNKEPGDFGNPVPWFDDYSMEMRAKELNNGRIAMFSAIGIIASSLYTGKPAIEQFGL